MKGNNKKIVLEIRGEHLTLKEWAERFGLTSAALYARLFLHRWTLERAITQPLTKTRRRPLPRRY